MKTKSHTIIEVLVWVAIVCIILAIIIPAVKSTKTDQFTGNYTVATIPVTLNGCEYYIVKISTETKDYVNVTHKGNCTNHVQLKAEQ